MIRRLMTSLTMNNVISAAVGVRLVATLPGTLIALAIAAPFFFQADDGIRDYKVTGVQTCALPISGPARPAKAPKATSAFAGASRGPTAWRSEEGRVGKECRSRWSPYHLKKKSATTLRSSSGMDLRPRRRGAGRVPVRWTCSREAMTSLSFSTSLRKSRIFFIQAEAGIRDYKVTGVLTCALPICIYARAEPPRQQDSMHRTPDGSRQV